MKIVSIAAVFGLLFFLSAPFASASTDNIRYLAQMTMNLDKPLSDADRASLNAIVDSDDATDEEATIALALSKFDQGVAPGDVNRLFEVVEDDLSDESARVLAGILLRLNQNPEADDAAMLAELAK
ncbi:MAG: hypothetical protein QNI96_13865 [Woeseiaceae bacterium]|nr:hypothetical protein [Woeseiaceae bacterium]